MKYVLSLCIMLALSTMAYDQQPDANPHVATPSEPQPDPTHQRLQCLRQTAFELEQAGKPDQAAAVRQQADRECQALLRRLDVLQTEVEQIRQAVGTGTQVVVYLQIAEVSLTKLQHLGFDLARAAGDGKTKANIDRTTFNAQWAAITKDGSKAQKLLEALRKDNLARVLAEPTLVIMSGKTVVFNSGGELPVPKPQPDGTVAIERQYGIMVELTSEVLDERVYLTIHGRLSELDYRYTVRVGKETVPGVEVRDFSTHTELKSGQTLAIRGLNTVRMEVTARGVPYVSELPYVGAAFRSVEETRNELALLILVRPEIMLPPGKAVLSASAGLQGETRAAQATSLNR